MSLSSHLDIQECKLLVLLLLHCELPDSGSPKQPNSMNLDSRLTLCKLVASIETQSADSVKNFHLELICHGHMRVFTYLLTLTVADPGVVPRVRVHHPKL